MPDRTHDVDIVTADGLTNIANQSRFYFVELTERGFTGAQAMELVKLWHASCVGRPSEIIAPLQQMVEAVLALADRD